MAAAGALAQIAGQMEQIAKAGDLSAAHEILASLQVEVDRCNQFVEEAVKELSMMDRADLHPVGGRIKLKEFNDASDHC